MRIGVLTGGGDCPGLNAVMRAIVRRGERHYDDEIVGFLDGWRGVIDGATERLDVESLRGTLPRGGTIIGSSRTNPFKVEGGADACTETLARLDIDALVAIGGEDTLGRGPAVPRRSASRSSGCPRPSTTTCQATELTFGFDTAVQIATEAIDRLHTTARVAPPGDGRRGHGSPRRPHRHVVGHRRRGQP